MKAQMIWLPRYGRFTATLTPTGRRLLAVMGGRVDPASRR